MSKPGWYIDSSTARDASGHFPKKIWLIKHVREFTRLGLNEAKYLVDQSENGPVLLPIENLPNKSYSGVEIPDEYWIRLVAETGAFLRCTRVKPGSAQAAERAQELLAPTAVRLKGLTVSELTVLARLYGVKKRSRMGHQDLVHHLYETLAYREACNPGVTNMLIREAREIASAKPCGSKR